MLCVGCSSPAPQGSPGASSSGTGGPSGSAGIPASGEPPTSQASPVATLPAATEAPASPGTVTTDGFRFDDILKVQVNGLAVRVAPDRLAHLVHQYLILGTTASDLGEVRLNKGDYVKVQLGPLPIGNAVWYLVWPASGGQLDDQTTNWYDKAPLAGQPTAAWVATKVGSSAYLALSRRPTAAQIAAVEPVGLFVAGAGNYVSAPMPRHDAFQLYWATAAAAAGVACSFKVELVPDDADFASQPAASATTSTQKVGLLNGDQVLWPVAASGTFGTFTLDVTSTCRWAIRLIRLEHD